MSEALWLAEGFTQYYGNLIQVRSGVIPPQEFWDGLGRLINAKETSPGGKFYTPIQNSQHAVFVDASASIDKNNYGNMYSSYYTYGGAIALALDMELRNKFNKSLDVYMQQLWKQFGKKEVPYTLAGLQLALSNITNPGFATSFFQKYIYGHESYNYGAALSNAGFRVIKNDSITPTIGRVSVRPVEKGLLVTSNIGRNTPLYNAGVDVDDILVELNGAPLKEQKNLEVVKSAKVGESIPLTYIHRGSIIKTTVKPGNDNYLKLLDVSSSGESKVFRENWIGNKAK
jgi:predicted metalloprotease with PDZ domain